MARLLLVLCLLPTAAAAQALVTAVLDAPGLPEAAVRRVQRATEATLQQVSSLRVGEGPAFKKGAPRKCDQDCARATAASLGTAGAVLLELRALDPRGERLALEAQLWLDGERLGTKKGEGTVDAFEAAVRPVLEALLPAWARRGFGGLRLEVEPGAVVKVDGRLATAGPGEVQAVTAGVHQVDVLFPAGHAVLQRYEVGEGSRAAVQVTSPAAGLSPRPRRVGVSPLRAASYGVWMAGAASLAAGLVAGALGRGTAAGLASCQGDVRACATLDEVLVRQRQAEDLAATGNVLLGVGAGLAAVGVGLFVVDLVTE